MNSDRGRELLPGLEPDRRIDDWGRSERVEEAFDRTIIEILYRYWFRVEVEGVEHVPADRGALLAANQAGPLSPEAALIARAIREEHPRPRPVHVAAGTRLRGLPGASMLGAKLGCVGAHPANLYRLLADERRLVLLFPEGARATDKPLWQRYRLRGFGRGGFVESAMRAGAKLIGVCVLGSEEASPVLGSWSLPSRISGLPTLPVTPTFPWLGLLGAAAYLPAKLRIRFLEPIDTARMGSDPAADSALVQAVTEELRARLQEGLHQMVAARRSVWLG